MTAIGIDLGTTYCCVAAVKKGKIEVIASASGSRTIPSYVAFSQDEDNHVIVGEIAKYQASSNLDNTIYDIKRMMGCKFTDIVLQEDMKRWSFDVIDIDNTPRVEYWDGQKENFTPEELSAYLLKEMKQAAEDYLDEKIEKAVIAVPAQFTSAQRKATLEAGKLAGLNVIALLNEPSAAAVAYGLKNQNEKMQTILVFDFGGGTFDVTILCIKDNVFEVKTTGGNTHLGGEDVTNNMVQHYAAVFNEENELDMTKDKKSMDRLRQECEKVKKALSASKKTILDIDSLFQHHDFQKTVTREEFESINKELFEETIDTVKTVLANIDMDKSEIDKVALIGGSSRIPKIRQLIFDYFGKDPSKAINPDEAVAEGAAVYAAHLAGDTSLEIDNIVLKDVTPLSLGVALAGGIMKVIVPRDTVIPTKKFHSFCTTEDNQTHITVKVYEGERAEAKKNIRLGKFKLTGIEPAPKGAGKFIVCFDIGADGLLTVTARDKATGKESSIVISGDIRASYQETAKMVKEGEKHKSTDESIREEKRALTKMESIEHRLKNLRVNAEECGNLTDEQKFEVKEKCSKMLEELQEKEKVERENLQELQKKVDEIEYEFSNTTRL